MTYLVYKWLKQEEKTCMSSRGGTFTILSSQLGLVRHIYLIPQCFWKILKILMFWFQWMLFHHLNIVSFLLMTIFSSAARYSKGKMNLGFYVLNSDLFAQKCKNVFLSKKKKIIVTANWSCPPRSRNGNAHQLPGNLRGPDYIII